MGFLNINLVRVSILLMLLSVSNAKVSNDDLKSNNTLELESNQASVINKTVFESKKEFSNPSNLSISEISVFKDRMNITTKSGFFNGYNLFIPEATNLTNGNFIFDNNELMITDMEGNIIYQNPNLHEPAEFYNSTTIMARTRYSDIVLWNFETNITQDLGIKYGHHEIEYNYNNNTIFSFVRNLNGIEINGSHYVFDDIIEYDVFGNIKWFVNTSSFISPSQWDVYRDMKGSIPDVTHSNSIFYDTVEDVIYVNVRNVNTFYKIDHKTGEIIWSLGEYGNFTLFDKQGDIKDNLFYHAHAVELIEDNKFILFDNDYHNQTNSNNHISRLLEITVNESSMTANETWSWSSPKSYFSRGLGDADTLPNKNRFGVFGEYHSDVNIGARLVEVTENGTIVWEMNFPILEDNVLQKVYRAERFRFAPYLESPDDIVSLPMENISITWNAWYNYRPKDTKYGQYHLYLNNQEIRSGSHQFDRLWRPSDLSFNINGLDIGEYNLSLALSDGEGHFTTESVTISVEPFYIAHNREQRYQHGSNNSFISWFGATVSPIDATFYVNETFHSTFIWEGDNFTLNLDNLDIGIYNVTFQLLNMSNSIYIENLRITIYPAVPPEIISFPLNQSIIWNETLTLHWEVQTSSFTHWIIFVDQTIYSEGNLFNPTNYVIWDIPILNEGYYNISIYLKDLNGNEITNTTWILINSPLQPSVSTLSETRTHYWKQDPVNLTWEVHGGENWVLWINDVNILADRIMGNTLNYLFNNSKPGIYNVSLQIFYESYKSVSSSIIIEVLINFSDPYANSFFDGHSFYFTDGENALGKPDQKFAQIFSDYENGYITFDMGFNEHITNGEGLDFEIIGGIGEYSVFVGNDLNKPFSYIGYGNSNTSFDLSSLNIDIAKYIRIEYRAGERLELDGIIALHYLRAIDDMTSPAINQINDFWVWENQTSIMLTWQVFDLTPSFYSIFVNGIAIEENDWDGTNINFRLELKNYESPINITILVQDVLDNKSSDTVIITIKSILSETSSLTSTPPSSRTSTVVSTPTFSTTLSSSNSSKSLYPIISFFISLIIIFSYKFARLPSQ